MDQPDNMSTEQWLKDSHIFSAHTYSIFQEDEVLTMASLKGMNSEQLSVFLSRPFKLGAQTALKQLLCNTGRAGSRPDSSSNVRRSPAPAEAPPIFELAPTATPVCAMVLRQRRPHAAMA